MFVLINGKVLIREHDCNNPIVMEIKQTCRNGYIFGADDLLVSHFHNKPYMWSIIGSYRADFIKIPKDTFYQMWNDFTVLNKEVGLTMLRQFRFFDKLSMQTQYMIMYEKGRLTTYKKGQTVMKIHHRSPWNKETELYYRSN